MKVLFTRSATPPLALDFFAATEPNNPVPRTPPESVRVWRRAVRQVNIPGNNVESRSRVRTTVRLRLSQSPSVYIRPDNGLKRQPVRGQRRKLGRLVFWCFSGYDRYFFYVLPFDFDFLVIVPLDGFRL